MNATALVVLALLFPLCAGAGDKSYKEGQLLEGPVKAKDSVLGGGNTRVTSKNWIFVLKIGDYRYTALADRVGGIFAASGPKTDDWPVNANLRVHFHRRMGSLYVDLTSPTGKEEESLWVISKVGADGKELCGTMKCQLTAEDEDS